MRLVEFGDVGCGDTLLCVVHGKNLGPLLGAFVGPLPVQLRRVVGHGRIDLQQVAEGDLLRVESDLYRFGVAGSARADLPVAVITRSVITAATKTTVNRILKTIFILGSPWPRTRSPWVARQAQRHK